MRHAHCTPLKTLNWRQRQAALEQRAAMTERDSTWWASEEARQKREGFTELARKHVRPLHDVHWKFREQGD